MKEHDAEEKTKPCPTGQIIKCGDFIRLEHVATGKNLHSHNIQSPLSHRNEVSGFGDDGEGDPSDNWQIECFNTNTGEIDTGTGAYVTGQTLIQLRHVDTLKLLVCDHSHEFNQWNCPRCPI